MNIFDLSVHGEAIVSQPDAPGAKIRTYLLVLDRVKAVLAPYASEAASHSSRAVCVAGSIPGTGC